MMASSSTRFVLLNLAHQQRRPQCDRAAFRILGVFSTVEEAKEHAALVPKDASLHVLPLQVWTPLTRDENVSPADAIAHLEHLGRRHQQRIDAHDEEFRDNLARQKTGAVTAVAVADDTAVSKFQAPAGSAPVSTIPVAAEVRMQRFAIVSVIHDEDKKTSDEPDLQEPALLVWEVCETESEAEDIIKTQLGRRVSDVHLDVVAMYEWLFPTQVDLSRVKEEYRDPKLDELMKYRKEEHLRVAEFRKLCHERGQEVPVIDISKPPPLGDDEQLAIEIPPPEPPLIDG